MIRRLALAVLSLAAVLLTVTAGAFYWFLSGDGVRRALEREATAWLGQPVRVGEASVTLFPRVSLRLRDVRAGAPARLTLAAVDLSAPLRALLSRRIENADVIVSDSRIEMPLPFVLPFRRADADAQAGSGADAADPLDVVSVRTIALRNVTLASRGRQIRISAESSLADTRLALTRFTASSGETRLDATGAIELSPRIDATIDARADALDVDDLLALVSAFMTPAGAAASTPEASVRVLANITAPRGRLAGAAFTRLDAAIRAEGRELTIDPFTFDVFGGRHHGWLEAQLGDTLQVRVGTSVANLDVAQLAAFGGAADTISGRLVGSGRFGARGRDLASVLASARGVGEMVISNGSMRGLDIVRTAVGFLGRPVAGDPPAGGERFEELGGTFALGDRVVRSEDLTVRSPDFDVFARGTLRLATKALEGRADLVLSDAVSAQAGRDLYRYTRAGNRIVLPATLGGTLARPRVGIDAAAALRRGIRNEIERRLEGLFERPRLF